ncbi:MAG TPA: OmpA family protein [Paludibacteraceae bacterium]|nr:OmpA family protein [Paludibacteraceae bacterium]HPT44210.1 OmpA family protein [Paludibacteraceae bacterium]
MKKLNVIVVLLLSASLILSGCKSLNNAAKGGMIGAGTGAAVGAGLGVLIGKDGKSAAVGAAIGTAVGTTAGVIIGKKMDKAAAETAAQVENAKVETIEDVNGLKAVKVTFDSGILFEFNKSNLNDASKTALTKFAKILVENPTMDISVLGHTDNIGTLEANKKVSLARATAVADYLVTNGAARSQMKTVEGRDYSMPVATNDTEAGRALNRRVEVYMYASEKMIDDAQKAASTSK